MTRLHLALALARCAGKAVTKELASQILAEVFPHGDHSIPVESFLPSAWQGYSLQAERISGNEAELRPLHDAYHRDTRVLETDPDYDFARLREAEREGKVAMFTARTGTGELVGIMRIRVWRALEDRRLQACDDMFYVAPAHRGGMLAVRLWQFAERTMFDFGVREVTFDSLSINGAEKMARFLGYSQVAIKFHKVAQEACNYSQVPGRHRQGVEHEPLAQN